MNTNLNMDNEFVQITINLWNIYNELMGRNEIRNNPELLEIMSRFYYITRMLEESLPGVQEGMPRSSRTTPNHNQTTQNRYNGTNTRQAQGNNQANIDYMDYLGSILGSYRRI